MFSLGIVCFGHGKLGGTVSICIVSNMFDQGSGCGKTAVAIWWECVNGLNACELCLGVKQYPEALPLLLYPQIHCFNSQMTSLLSLNTRVRGYRQIHNVVSSFIQHACCNVVQ